MRHSRTITAPCSAIPDPTNPPAILSRQWLGDLASSVPTYSPPTVPSRALCLGVRQIRLHVSSATPCVTVSNPLTSLRLSVLSCEMEMEVPVSECKLYKPNQTGQGLAYAGRHRKGSFLFTSLFLSTAWWLLAGLGVPLACSLTPKPSSSIPYRASELSPPAHFLSVRLPYLWRRREEGGSACSFPNTESGGWRCSLTSGLTSTPRAPAGGCLLASLAPASHGPSWLLLLPLQLQQKSP